LDTTSPGNYIGGRDLFFLSRPAKRVLRRPRRVLLSMDSLYIDRHRHRSGHFVGFIYKRNSRKGLRSTPGQIVIQTDTGSSFLRRAQEREKSERDVGGNEGKRNNGNGEERCMMIARFVWTKRRKTHWRAA
jgi:hypothetical protein